MAGVNKVILLGNVGNDPEIRPVGESKVALLSIATSESYKDKSGQKVEQTEWHRVELWGNLAEIVEKYVKKGSQLYVEGKIKTEEYTDKEGVVRKAVKIRATTVTLLGSKEGSVVNNAPVTHAPPAVPTENKLPSYDSGDGDLPF